MLGHSRRNVSSNMGLSCDECPTDIAFKVTTRETQGGATHDRRVWRSSYGKLPEPPELELVRCCQWKSGPLGQGALF